MNDLEEEGKRHMNRVYRKKDLTNAQTIDELIDSQFSFQRQSTTLDASSTKFKEAVCGRKYREASWNCFIMNCFNQQSGINAINVYANRLLVKMREGGGEFPLTPCQGTYVIGSFARYLDHHPARTSTYLYPRTIFHGSLAFLVRTKRP